MEVDAPSSQLAKGGVSAEWHRARLILAHTPGAEIRLGALHPSSALFRDTFDTLEAANEHARYVRLLRERGSDVRLLSEVLETAGTDPKNRGKLEALATRSAVLDASLLSVTEAEAQKQYFQMNISRMSVKDLVWTVLNRPTVRLRPDDKNTFVDAEYGLDPLSNLFFQRDQLIAVKQGVILGRMNSRQRRHETEVVRFALELLGIDLIGEIEFPGVLEGGDFLPADSRAYIAEGLRTNRAAISTLLTEGMLTFDEVVVVKDQWKRQEQMHLDTYFNLIDRDLAVMAVDRLDAPVGSDKRLYADVFQKREDGAYQESAKDVDFVEFIRKDAISIVAVPKGDSQFFAANFLTLAPREIVIVDGTSERFISRLRSENVKITKIGMNNLRNGWGAAHCTTQVLYRVPEAGRAVLQ